jgi:hypothetical protein
VKLIDVHGTMISIPFLTLSNPRLILTLISFQIADTGSGIGTVLHGKSKRIRLIMPGTILVLNTIFVCLDLFIYICNEFKKNINTKKE